MTSAVVVGSGIAGLTTALGASARGIDVTLITKDVLAHAATRFAQGGIAGVMTSTDTGDEHFDDTMRAGAGLTDAAAARVLVDEGPDRIRELIDAGVPFDRDADGALKSGLEAAHSHPRILHAGGDATGAAIERTLLERLAESAVTVLEHTFLVDLIVEDARAVGVVIDTGGERRSIRADAVVLATGGAGQLYAKTTNPVVATGDGIAAALRAGVQTADLEFVQFHPTVLATGAAFLVSEAVRGEGATLVDTNGHRFAFDAHPDGELAPRDVVARAIAMREGPAYLDATALGREFLARRFPTIDAAVRERGLDWAMDPIEVTPAAHYMMGGVATDLDGRTSLAGLYAVGEVARTGVHGANRLASNSLLEGAVFGARAADAIAARTVAWPTTVVARSEAPVVAAAPTTPFTRSALQQLMWERAGLIRDADGLAQAASTIAQWQAARDTTGHGIADLEDDNLLTVAAAVVSAAREREHSIGAHWRSDDAIAAASRPSLQEVGAC